MEQCKGCGIATKGTHPFVAIGKDAGDEVLQQWPVCKECWEDPEHRTLGPLKAHFHERSNAERGLKVARSLERASLRGEDIGLGIGE